MVLSRQHIKTILLVLVTCYYFPQQLNRFNKKGERTGKWITYSDSAKTKKIFEGKYKRGNTVGHCYYYTMDGILERKEVPRMKKIKTTFYYPKGITRCRGNAKVENLPNKIHYYFYGRWKYYDTNGVIQKYIFFEKGSEVKTVYKNRKDKTSDSLVDELNKIADEFMKKNSGLIDSINSNYTQLATSEIYRTKLNNRDSASFLKIENYLTRYGYPTKQLAKESINTPFFILSYGSLKLRDKYSETLIKAANKGDLSWETLSFFIDKLEIAKTGKQIYGTQSYMDKEKRWQFYPIIEPESLDKRREKIGLKALNQN